MVGGTQRLSIVSGLLGTSLWVRFCGPTRKRAGPSVLEDCQIVDLRKIADPRGNLTPIESFIDVPFQIERVYYLYDVPGGSHRGGHAHKELQQLIIAISGSFDVTLDDGTDKQKFTLNRPYFGLQVCPMTWREIDNFSSASVCMVIASQKFDESDYYRDYSTFRDSIAK